MEGSAYCHLCAEEVTLVNKSGWVFRKTPQKGSLKKYWLQLIGRELYMQKNPDGEEARSMQTLVDVEFKLSEPIQFNNTKYFGFELVNGDKSRVYYLGSIEERDSWAEALVEALGYKDIFEVYRMEEKVGQGHFGSVRRAVNKVTGKQAAVKILNKNRMSPAQLEMQRAEIETLKVCQHPHICTLIDIFENSDKIFIVTEFMHGGDLFDYQERRKFQVGEDRC